MQQRGFTLLELLVVIGIMALLFMLIIIALNSVRRDAFNTRIQSNVRQMRALAESAYDSNGATYIDWTLSPAVQAEVITVLNDIDDAHGDSIGAPYITTIRETQQKDYCVSAPLHTADGGHACVDSTGVFRTSASPCAAQLVDGDPLRCPAI